MWEKEEGCGSENERRTEQGKGGREEDEGKWKEKRRKGKKTGRRQERVGREEGKMERRERGEQQPPSPRLPLDHTSPKWGEEERGGGEVNARLLWESLGSQRACNELNALRTEE